MNYLNVILKHKNLQKVFPIFSNASLFKMFSLVTNLESNLMKLFIINLYVDLLFYFT